MVPRLLIRSAAYSKVGDVIRIRLPHPLVPISVGDLLLATGVVALIVLLMRTAPRAPAGGRPADQT
jgi:hypothetical protein